MRRTMGMWLLVLLTACNGDQPADSPKLPVDDTDPSSDSDSEAPAGTDADSDGVTVESGDCNDGDASVFPGATELCNNVDDDCDGAVDDDAAPVAYYYDADGDGYGDSASTLDACGQPDGYAAAGGDCDESNPDIHPGAEEQCDGGDEDCDGLVDADDPDLTLLTTWYRDADADSYGDSSNAVSACTQPIGYVLEGGDCDDTNGAVSPGAPEHCDGADEDCDGVVDEDGVDGGLWYEDADADGYGDASASVPSCTALAGYTTLGTDCDDGDATVNPAASEECSNDVDDNCDGSANGCRLSGDVDLSTLPGRIDGTEDALQIGRHLGRAGDVDGDGIDDIVAGADTYSDIEDYAGVAWVFRGPVTGPLTEADAYVTVTGTEYGEYVGIQIATLGDVDADGNLDWGVARGDGGAVEYAGSLAIFDGGLTGNLTAADAAAVILGESSGQYPGAGTMLAPGDVDGDGFGDLIADDYADSRSRVALYSGPFLGDMLVSDVTTFLALGGYAAEYADLTGDGLAEFIISDPSAGTNNQGSVFVLDFVAGGEVDLSLEAASILGGAASDYLGLDFDTSQDVDGDGHVDLAVGGSGEFGIIYAIPAPGSIWSDVADVTVRGGPLGALADFDGDGAVDISAAVDYGNVHVWYGPAAGNYDTSGGGDVELELEDDVYSAELTPISDVDGDGATDLIIGNNSADVLADNGGTIYIMTGFGDW